MSRSLSEFVAGITLAGCKADERGSGRLGVNSGGAGEAHYMRGPGPKWRAKHVQISSRALGQQ
jgi:hypothetical protein